LQPFNQVPSYDYSIIEQQVSDFKTATFKQRADYLTQWNQDLGLSQLKDAVCGDGDIALQGLTELAPEMMRQLTAMNQGSPIIKLSLRQCYLAQIPKALIVLLSACTQLQRLNLSDNQLQSLPKNLLQACTQLRILYLSENQLQSLPGALLQTCTELQWLYLNNNQLQSLPGILLETCTQLQELYLYNNHLISVTPSSFSRLSKIHLLNIDSQTPVGASTSSTISPEQKTEVEKHQPHKIQRCK